MNPLKLSGFTGRKRSATLLGHLTGVPFFVNENIGQKILSKDLENIVKKVASGKTLTSAERSLVEKAYGTSGDVKFAKTIVELSEILGVSRKTIDRWRKLKGSPKPCSDGRHNVAKWRDFVRNHDLKEPDSPEDEELKTRKLLAEVKQAEIKLKVMEGTYVAIEKVREVWTAHIGQVRQILESRFLNELPPILTTLDAVQIREKLQEVLDETYKAISIAADSIKEPVDIED